MADLTMRDFEIAKIAQVCHEANKVWCELHGDTSQLHWEQAPEWQKDSAITGVKFAILNPDAKPEDSHNSWLAVKEADGWTYGDVKNVEKKEHPCFRPYKELPHIDRLKDSIFQTTVFLMKQAIMFERTGKDPG